jgi:hypothetical protein
MRPALWQPRQTGIRKRVDLPRRAIQPGASDQNAIMAAMSNMSARILAASLLLAAGVAPLALAQERLQRDRDGAALPRAVPTTSPSAEAPGGFTGKERLGGKWMDEQRLDNCNVPPDKRGSKPRPDTCAGRTTE